MAHQIWGSIWCARSEGSLAVDPNQSTSTDKAGTSYCESTMIAGRILTSMLSLFRGKFRLSGFGLLLVP